MTLIIIAMAVLGMGLIAGFVAISTRLSHDEKAIETTRSKLRLLASSISGDTSLSPRSYLEDVGSPPSSLTDLVSKATPPCTLSTAQTKLTGWCGPYWNPIFQGEDIRIDSWGHSFIYSTSPRQIRSLGPNGIDNSGGIDDLVQSF